MLGPEDLFDRLRRLAAEDPQKAKEVFLSIFESNSVELVGFLARLSKPNEGRLRQMVANAVRTHPGKRRVVPELVRWRETETDEFTRRAIEGALVDVDTTVQLGTGNRAISMPGDVVGMYRYVSSRLRHRLRNTMFAAESEASGLKKLMFSEIPTEIRSTIEKFSQAILILGRELEAIDVDPEYFRARSIVLAEWIRRWNAQYASRYAAVALELVCTENMQFRVFASDYLLETIFGNIWTNAQQAVGLNCEIRIEFQIAGPEVRLRISDNGEGLPCDLRGIAFEQEFSTKSKGRGRGLLEIQDAVERLFGRVELYEVRSGECRIQIYLPMDIR